jgi:hypothetical protein
MASAMILEASCHTLLDGATHVGGGTMVGLRQAFFLLSYLFSLISLGIVLAFKIYKKSCYLLIVSNLVLVILITLHFVLNLIFFFNFVSWDLVSFDFYIKSGSHSFDCYLFFIFILFLN